MKREPVEIVDRIWIGSWENASDPDCIRRHRFGLIVNATAHIDSPFKESVPTYRIPVIRYIDSEETLLQHIPRVARVISETLKRQPRKSVLVHCVHGTCRGPTIVAGYLILVHGMTSREAVRYIRSKIPSAFPEDLPLLYYSVLEKIERSRFKNIS